MSEPRESPGFSRGGAVNEKASRAMSALKNDWVRCGNWAMVRGAETITKAIVAGKPVYTRHDGERRVGQYESFKEASA